MADFDLNAPAAPSLTLDAAPAAPTLTLDPAADEKVVEEAKKATPGMVEDTAPRLARKIARTFGIRETYTRTMVCLDVMNERGLISLSAETDHLQIRVRPTQGKVDLEASYIMQQLRRLIDG